jgi:2-haloacid dehalogenase
MPPTAGPQGQTPPTAVVFDLGGVLIDWNPRHLYRQLFDGNDDAMERFLAEVTSPDWNLQQDAGRPWAEAVETLTREHPEHAALIAAFAERWPEMLGDAIRPTVDILAELRRRSVRLFALSNWSAETFPIARPRYPFLGWFEGIVISGEVRITKPDPRLYRHLLDRYGLDPAATVFIDDSEANVRAARELGMIAIRFEGGPALRRELVELGLLGETTTPVDEGPITDTATAPTAATAERRST